MTNVSEYLLKLAARVKEPIIIEPVVKVGESIKYGSEEQGYWVVVKILSVDTINKGVTVAWPQGSGKPFHQQWHGNGTCFVKMEWATRANGKPIVRMPTAQEISAEIVEFARGLDGDF